MNHLYLLITFPFIAGLIALLIPKRFDKTLRTLLTVSTGLVFALSIFVAKFGARFTSYALQMDNISALIILASGFFGFIVSVYSSKFFLKTYDYRDFAAYTLWSLSAAMGIIVSNNLAVLIVFWGFLGFSLYMLININPLAESTARKTFTIIGASDALLILGTAILITQGRFTLLGPRLEMTWLNTLAFVCISLAAFAKAGAFPLHIWIPDTAEEASIPISALLIASLDKLLGIYLLLRVVGDIFLQSDFATYFLLILGSITIIGAVMMALIQHDIKKLLGFHAVSQVGYMIIGIGMATPLGLIAGLFHMFNHTIYKTTLFLNGGSVEKQAGTTELDKLGGMAKFMPITFITTLVAAMAISGVPPFNGFASKWLIYQELANLFSLKHSPVYLFALICAITGSGLTLASFAKLMHAVYFSAPKRENIIHTEVSWPMWLPSAALAFLCVLFGVFASQLPLKYIAKSLPVAMAFNGKFGLWQSEIAAYLLVAGLLFGALIYLIYFKSQTFRRDDPFYGTESLDPKEFSSGTDFYRTIEDSGPIEAGYTWSKNKMFDIYHWGSKLMNLAGRMVSTTHTGKLNTYLLWAIAGVIIILSILVIK